MDTRRDVFQAIADPTRREIISLLAHQKLNLNAISENFHVSRQAISLHIKILQECGLVVINQQGRERHCELLPERLNEVHQWTEQFQVFWTKKLQALKQVVEEDTRVSANPASENNTNPIKKKEK